MVYDLIQNENDSCVYKEVSGSALTMNVLYKIMITYSFIGNDISIKIVGESLAFEKILHRILGSNNLYSKNKDLLG